MITENKWVAIKIFWGWNERNKCRPVGCRQQTAGLIKKTILHNNPPTSARAQAPPRPPFRGGHPLPRRVPRPGHRGRGAELLHGEGGQQQQPGRDRQRARTAGRAGLGEDTNMRPEYLHKISTDRMCVGRPASGSRWSTSWGAAWGSRRRSTPGELWLVQTSTQYSPLIGRQDTHRVRAHALRDSDGWHQIQEIQT